MLFGTGSIGQAIIRRIGVGKHIVLADYNIENAENAAKTLENAGYECSTIEADLGCRDDILSVVEEAPSSSPLRVVIDFRHYPKTKTMPYLCRSQKI